MFLSYENNFEDFLTLLRTEKENEYKGLRIVHGVQFNTINQIESVLERRIDK